MKTFIILTILALLLLAVVGNSQTLDISGQMRAGYSLRTNSPLVAPAIEFKAYGLSLTPEVIINTADNAPGQMGVKMAYEATFNKWAIQTGYGRYFDLYTTDKYDAWKNGWSNLWFLSVHYDRFFLEYDYNKESVLSFGMRESILNY